MVFPAAWHSRTGPKVRPKFHTLVTSPEDAPHQQSSFRGARLVNESSQKVNRPHAQTNRHANQLGKDADVQTQGQALSSP